MLPIFLFLTLTFSRGAELPDSAANTDPGTVFTQALESFKAHDYTKSREFFKTLLLQSPNDPVLLYNLGLVEFTDNHPGAAAAYWRRALWLSPGDSPSLEGLAQLQKKLPSVDVGGVIALYLRFPPWIYLFLSCALFLISGWLVLGNLKQAKSGQPVKAVYLTILSGILFLGLLGITTHYFFIYSQEERATLLENNTALYASPSESAPSLVSLPEGTDVLILREQKNSEEAKDQWFQVQKSSVQVGWVQKDKIFLHSGM